MPIYEFKDTSGLIHEEIFSVNDVPDFITLSNGDVAIRILSMPAFTPTKWGKRIGGVNGIYDPNLQRTVETHSEQAQAYSKKEIKPATINEAYDVATKQIATRKEQNKRLKVHEQQLLAQSQGKGYNLKAFESLKEN